MTRASLLSAGLLALSASAAVAEPLTCETFRSRFDGALLAGDSRTVPEAPVYRETGSAPDGSKRLSWSTPNLDGTLACGPDRQFREFYVSLAAASKDRFVEQIRRFVATNGAAICATVEATPANCIDAGKALLQAGLQQMGAAYQKKATAPSGLATRMLQPHLKGELTAAPTLITFTLGVVDAASFDAARAPLATLPGNAAQQP